MTENIDRAQLMELQNQKLRDENLKLDNALLATVESLTTATLALRRANNLITAIDFSIDAALTQARGELKDARASRDKEGCMRLEFIVEMLTAAYAKIKEAKQ